MIKYFTIVLLLSFPTMVLADTCPRTKIEKGTAAPCTGYILSPEAIEEATKLPKEISLLNDKLKLRDDQLSLKDERNKLLSDFIDKKDITINTLHTALLEKDKNESLKLGIAIGGSALATALICIGVAFAISGAIKLDIKQIP